MVHHALRNDHFGGRERGVNRAVVHFAVKRDAGTARHERHGEVVREVRMNHRRLAGHRLLDVDHGRQRIVINDDRVNRVSRDVAIARHDDRNRLAAEPNDVDRHRAMFGRGERRADWHRRKHFRDVGAGVNRFDPVHRRGGLGVDLSDLAVRDIAALEGDVLHADQRDIVHVGRAPLDQAGIFAALDALSDEFRQHRRGRHGYLVFNPGAPSPRSADFFDACWIALTMCW